MNLGSLILAAVLFRDVIGIDALVPPPVAPPPVVPPTQPPTPAGLTFAEWQKFHPGGSDLDYQDYILGV